MISPQRTRLLRLLIHLAPTGLTVAKLAKLVKLPYPTLYSKLRIYPGTRAMTEGEEAAILQAACLEGINLDQPIPHGRGPDIIEAIRRFSLVISSDELASAVGRDVLATLIGQGFLAVNDQGHLVATGGTP